METISKTYKKYLNRVINDLGSFPSRPENDQNHSLAGGGKNDFKQFIYHWTNPSANPFNSFSKCV